MPRGLDRAWYYLIPRSGNPRAIADRKLLEFGEFPISTSAEPNSLLHLLYARFWHMFLNDIGVVPEPEPFRSCFIRASLLERTARRCPKSRGNVVNPDAVIGEYGTDSLRLYLMFLGRARGDETVEPARPSKRVPVLNKVWPNMSVKNGRPNPKISATAADYALKSNDPGHETIRKVGDDIECTANSIPPSRR